MIGLFRLMEEHSLELEASLRSEYGYECRLSKVYSGEMTLRELKMFIRGLLITPCSRQNWRVTQKTRDGH